MAKKFTIKKLRLRARARNRKHSLKINPVSKGVKVTHEKMNEPVIASLEAKIRALAS
ncbi:MAG: hypothetical protein R3C61_28140 [Bacteroidia bacterium]